MLYTLLKFSNSVQKVFLLYHSITDLYGFYIRRSNLRCHRSSLFFTLEIISPSFVSILQQMYHFLYLVHMLSFFSFMVHLITFQPIVKELPFNCSAHSSKIKRHRNHSHRQKNSWNTSCNRQTLVFILNLTIFMICLTL